MNDLAYIAEMIDHNKKISINCRQEIHTYGLQNFDMGPICNSYINIISKLLDN